MSADAAKWSSGRIKRYNFRHTIADDASILSLIGLRTNSRLDPGVVDGGNEIVPNCLLNQSSMVPGLVGTVAEIHRRTQWGTDIFVHDSWDDAYSIQPSCGSIVVIPVATTNGNIVVHESEVGCQGPRLDRKWLVDHRHPGLLFPWNSTLRPKSMGDSRAKIRIGIDCAEYMEVMTIQAKFLQCIDVDFCCPNWCWPPMLEKVDVQNHQAPSFLRWFV